QTLRRKQGFRDVYDLELTLDDGSKKTVIVNAAPRFDRDGNFVSTLAVLTDITERKKEEQALAEAKQKLEKAIQELERRNEEARLLVCLGDSFQLATSEKEAVEIIKSFALELFPKDGFLLYYRQGQEKFLQLVASWNYSLSAEELIDLNDCWALRKAAPNFFIDREKDLLCPHLRISGAIAHPVACLPLYSSGETLGLIVVHCCSEKEKISFQDLEATMKAKKQLLISFAQRVSISLANIKLRDSLREQSIRDPLTGLYNRRYLEETLERELLRARRAGQTVAVIMLDIDHFKKINDFYGHDAGDFVLQVLAQTLQKAVRAEDIVCRFGGEEFTVILPTLSLEKAIARAELICESVRHLELNFAGTILQKITLSAGVAAYPDHGEKWTEIIQAADLALLEAKKEGRDRVKVAHKAGS
ncbi:MAG: diguanylate cyclase, partial [Candidatus Saccharicenans sp.]